MLLNDEKYKLVDIDSLDFSVRLRNAANKNMLNTLFDLIESYNSGEFEKMRNVGRNTVKELLDFYYHEVSITDGSKVCAEDNKDQINIDEILPRIFLESSIDKYVYDVVLYNHLVSHDIRTIRELLALSQVDMINWTRFGHVKIDIILEFQKRSKKGDICYILGGEVKSPDEITPSKDIDALVLNLLKTEYGLKYTWMCDWFGVTRQCVDQKLKRAIRTRTGKWDGFTYTEEEATIVLNMIKHRKDSYSSGEDFYYFMKNGKGDFAILIVNTLSIRCFFSDDIEGELKEYIITNRLNDLDFRELDIINNGKNLPILRVMYFVPAKKDMNDFKAYAKKRDMSKEEYAFFLTGKQYSNDCNITDIEICNFFDEHLNEDGKVYISADSSNQWIKSYASRKGYKISDFIEFYGYQTALPGDMLTSDGARKRHLERIKEYVIRDKVVYIPTYSDFYKILNSYSTKRSLTVTEYVEDLGYERTLTSGYFKDTGYDLDVFDAEEKDMDILEIGDGFLDKVFANNPLIGNYIFSESNLVTLHSKAKIITDTLVSTHGYRLSREQKMIIALSVINYAKNWDTNLGTFTNFITKQYGYRSEDRVYPKIMTAVYDAIKDNGRWGFSTHGNKQYKSTVMIHAMGSIRSWMHLCDFLSDFYQNNLGCHYVADDPYVLSMVMFLRGIFYESEISDDDENYAEFTVGATPYRFQEGIRKLVVYRPNYAAKVFDRMLNRIHAYMCTNVSPAKKYEDSLVDFWFKNKTEYYFRFKRKLEKTDASDPHRIAFEYNHIRLFYRFINNNVWIDIPDIRLSTHSIDTCYFEIYDREQIIDRRSLKCYGNELGKTISGVTYSLHDYLSITESGEICPRIVIKCGDNVLYDSIMKLRRKILIFDGEKEKDISTIEVGRYVAVAPIDVTISGIKTDINVIKTVEDFKYLNINFEDNFSFVVDDRIVSFDRKKTEKIRVNLPNYVSGVKYVENGLEYSICKSSGEISIAVDENDVEQKYVIMLNGKRIAFSDLVLSSDEGINIYTLPDQIWRNDKNRFQIVDFSNNKMVVDKWFILIPSFSYSFDSEFYFTEKELQDCCVEYSIGGKGYEIVNSDENESISVDYDSGMIVFDIPRIHVKEMNGSEWKKRDYFYEEIERGDYLKLELVSGIEGKLYVGNTVIQRDLKGLFTLGNTLFSLMEPSTEKLKLTLTNQQGVSKTYMLGKIIFKEQFVSMPKVEYVDGKLLWDCGYGFIGNTSKNTCIRITDVLKNTVYDKTIDLEVSLIEEGLNLSEGEYHYSIYRDSEDIFSLDENELAAGAFVCGNYDRIRFNCCRIAISQIVFDNAVASGLIDILPVYIDNIKYDEALSKEESSEGICPTYFGTMYFINPDGQRHDFAFEDENRSATDIRIKTNPVKLIYINDSVMLITDSDDDALMYRFYFDRYSHEKIYHITDHKQTTLDRDNYDSVDLLRYRKERI